MSAAAARAAQLDSIADNLANAESPGYKAQRPAFQSFLPKGGSDKILAGAVATGTDLRPGVMVSTGEPLDVVPAADHYFAVQTMEGVAYTRNGKLAVGPDGTLLAAGRPVLGRANEPIVIPEGTVPRIDELGDVIVDDAVLDSLALFSVQGPMDRVGNSLLLPTADATVTAVVDGSVRTGELELGNAPPIESAVQMISAQRHFDTAMQAIQTYKRLDERAIELGRIR
jgi:flagellar basal-body rod protein FlgF